MNKKYNCRKTEQAPLHDAMPAVCHYKSPRKKGRPPRIEVTKFDPQPLSQPDQTEDNVYQNPKR